MEVRVLGDFEVVHNGRTVAVRGAKQRALLAVLALRPGEVVSGERLAECIWGDDQPANPSNALQAQVSALRKLLPDGVLVTRGTGYAVDLPPDAIDAARFEELAREGRRLLAEGDAVRASTTLRDGLALWRGPALADFAYHDFAQADITRLEEARLSALEARLDADLVAGRHADVVGELEALTTSHPLREGLWRLRMIALYRCGRQADALRVYGDARATLVEELGIEPGPELRRTEAMVLAQAEELTPPLASPTTSSGNLRARLTRFVGRDAEVKEIVTLLRTERLLTLVGPGGVGKTRLAVETADVLSSDVPDGAWLVELAPVTDAGCVTCTIANALDLDRAGGGRNGSQVMMPVERIAQLLTGRAPLVVMDNCEHLVETVAAVVDHLLGAVAGLRVIATSREALGVPGEAIVPIGALAPDPAVELFVDRARAVDRGFVLDESTRPLVADTCRRLDGLPLALELAAARLRHLPLRQIAARLDDRFRLLTAGARTALPRQQTLRAVVDWSYDLLSEDERRLFNRLSVFPGGARAEAIEMVCRPDTIDMLTQLVDKSLVFVDYDHDGEPRYRQLQTLSAYAAEKLAEDGADRSAVHDRHARWFRQLAEGAEDGLRGPDGPECRRAIDADLDNLRAALDWLVARSDAAGALALTVGMAWFWFLRAEYHEGVRWPAEALSVDGDAPAALRIRAEAWRDYYAAIVDEPLAAIHRLYDELDRIRVHGTSREVGEVAVHLASALNRVTRYDEALAVLDEARAALGAADHEWGLAVSDLLATLAYARVGRLAEAEAAGAASLARFERCGERIASIEVAGTMAGIREVHGDLAAAAAEYDELIVTARDLDTPGYLAIWLVWRGAVTARLGDDAAAVAFFGEALALRPNPVTRSLATIGRARALARTGGAAGMLDELGAACSLLAAAGRADARAVAFTALALTALDAGDAATARRQQQDAAALDADMAALAGAALAGHEGDVDSAAQLLSRWANHHLPGTPHGVAGLVAADHAHLSGTAAEPQRVG